MTFHHRTDNFDCEISHDYHWSKYNIRILISDAGPVSLSVYVGGGEIYEVDGSRPLTKAEHEFVRSAVNNMGGEYALRSWKKG